MKSYAPLFALILFIGCATQTTTHAPKIQKEKTKRITPEEIFENYPVNVSLKENKILFEKLQKEIISKSEYDSSLTGLGRIGEKYNQIDQLLCAIESDSIFRELVRAEYFINNDSLLNTVEKQLKNLTIADSANAVPYIFLGISRIKQNDYENGIKYLQKAKNYTAPFDNSWIFIALGNLYNNYDYPFFAIKEYEEGFEINSKLLIENWDNLYDLYITTSQFEKAENLFGKIEQISPEQDFRRIHWDKLVDLYWKKNDMSNAKSICLNVQDSTNFEATTKELVSISLKKGDYKGAEKYLWDLSSVEILSYPLSSKFNFGDFYILDDHYLESLEQLQNEIKELSQNTSANFCFGYLLVAKELNKWNKENRDESKVNEGLAYLKESITDNADANFIVGFALQTLDEKAESKSFYERVPKQSKYHPYSLINLAVMTQSDDTNKSLDYLLEAQQILMDEIKLIEEIGDYYYLWLNDYGNSIKWYKRLLSYEPTEHLKSLWIADSYLKVDDTYNAQLTISQTIDRIFADENSWSENWYLGMAYKTKGDINQKLEKWDQAKRDYENSIKYDPKDMGPYLALASVYYQLEDLQSAENTYLTVIDSVTSKENVDSENYYKALSSLNIHYLTFDIDSYKHAKLFEKAINYFPDDNWCYRMLGIAYRNQGNYYKATINLKKAIELEPDNRYNYYNLAETYAQEGTLDKAIENYKYAIRAVEKENLKIDKKNEFEDYQSNLKSIGEYHSKIANLYKEKEDYDLAILEYQKAISITPDTTGIIFKFALADAYFNDKDLEKAIQNWETIYNKNRDRNALYNIGLSYLNLGGPDNLRKAKSTFLELLEQVQDDPNYIDSKTKAENFIKIIDSEIDILEWPDKIDKLASSDHGLITEIAQLYQVTSHYRDINNMWINGVKETTPNKEYLSYSKEWIVTSYDVSPKIFQSESLCDRFKAKVSSVSVTNTKLKEVQSLWISAAESRKEGISEHSKGFYVKSKDYSGEYERGRAKINVADQYYADGLKILKNLMEENIDSFSSFGVESIQNMIDYYAGESKQ